MLARRRALPGTSTMSATLSGERTTHGMGLPERGVATVSSGPRQRKERSMSFRSPLYGFASQPPKRVKRKMQKHGWLKKKPAVTLRCTECRELVLGEDWKGVWMANGKPFCFKCAME